MLTALVALFLSIGSMAPDHPAATGSTLPQPVCPAEAPDTRTLAHRFLTRPHFAGARADFGLNQTVPANVRLLTDPADSTVCQRLNVVFGSGGEQGSWRWSYYQVGSYYFVAIQHVDTGGTQRIGFVPLFIYDSAFNRVAGYAM